MKLSQFSRPKIDLHSVALQTTLELFAGAVFCAMVLRWIES